MLVEIPLGHLLVFWKDPPVEGERGIEQGRADAIHLFDLYVFHDSHQRRRGGKKSTSMEISFMPYGKGGRQPRGGKGFSASDSTRFDSCEGVEGRLGDGRVSILGRGLEDGDAPARAEVSESFEGDGARRAPTPARDVIEPVDRPAIAPGLEAQA